MKCLLREPIPCIHKCISLLCIWLIPLTLHNTLTMADPGETFYFCSRPNIKQGVVSSTRIPSPLLNCVLILSFYFYKLKYFIEDFHELFKLLYVCPKHYFLRPFSPFIVLETWRKIL